MTKSQLKKAYVFVSVQFFSIFLVLVLINMATIPFIYAKEKNNEESDTQKTHDIITTEAYTNPSLILKVDTEYIQNVMGDFMDYTYQYKYYPREDYIQAPFSSTHVNVIEQEDDLTHRLTLTPSDSQSIRIYCFGGSTTFGSLVSDEHTWPSQLMKHVGTDKVWVKNYGLMGSSPTQETDAFIDLLKMGHRPGLVIFMDGVNTGPSYDGSEFSMEISKRFNYQDDNSWTKMIGTLPALRQMKEYFGSPELVTDTLGLDIMYPAERTNKYNKVLASRFIENYRIRKQIGELYGITVIQIWQPNVFINYDLNFLNDIQKKNISELALSNYKEIYHLVMQSGIGYVDFTSLTQEYKYPALVDGLHYSPDFNRFIAIKVAKLFQIQDLHKYRFEKDSITGIPFKQ